MSYNHYWLIQYSPFNAVVAFTGFDVMNKKFHAVCNYTLSEHNEHVSNAI